MPLRQPHTDVPVEGLPAGSGAMLVLASREEVRAFGGNIDNLGKGEDCQTAT